MTADREAAIREAVERVQGDPMAGDVAWLLAELVAAREREEKLREALRQYVAAIDRGEQGHVAALRAALSEGEG